LTLTDKFNRRNQELSELVLQRSQDVEAWKSMTNRLAEDMKEFVARTRNEIPIFSDMLKNGFEALGKTMSLSLDFAHPKPTELEAAGSLIADLRSKLASGQQPVSDFREIIGRIPRMSKAINRAKRKTLETLDLLLSHVVSGEKMARELEASIRALACKQDPSTAQ
jgi:hypothetical protein